MEKDEKLMEKIISLCKRRGFVYPGSEIYGGLAGTFDYGPLGSLLKKNIEDSWIEYFVKNRENIYLIDTPILMHPRVWDASGHTSEFIDPLVDDLVTKKRYRADHILEDAGVNAEKLTVEEMDQKIKELELKSPDGNKYSDVRKFNLMLETKMGAVEETSVHTFLRPEEAQSMFVNFKNVLQSLSPKIPFGIAQIGKAFRNEITPRDFIYRLREFEIMEFEYFIHPTSPWEAYFDNFLLEQKEWLSKIGVDTAKLHPLEHPETARAHYSRKTVDLEFEYPFGTKELTGLSHRGDFDLKRHQEFSGESMWMMDEATGEKFIPHVIEPTISVDRAILATLCSCYREDPEGKSTSDGASGEGNNVRVYLKLPPSVAPYKACVSPLLKNKPELVTYAKSVYGELKKEFGWVVWDDNGNIGKRYRRQDEIGTPWCIVIDFDTLSDDSVTIRDRDTGQQERIKKEDIVDYIKERMN
ncbi:glycine--tRNA ligase [Candidatus Nomurabacteria bacterium RIFOXYC2_FULL_36_8]|nr:MAG: glycyl-tRNA synthetase [Candidatus Nomurabacteria bacterium GW2011_GWF2_36_126]KKP96871.1 MAG: glycyl-tRNA synthetase [Candidatus Nomurabacteria bacterium GW2011_GWD2_36_14]KKP99525.1 MAG: glycyl-tRNA synthetase [Candidatus Nomurabacteria bacterium GW2011_GWF2_36_19]KKQ05619.1 MAG: glycyl-tRNA synthetase [Candidatus Nomurabacteria bacterium GW2011_GWF1_36_47]KKQ09796.1 MAG: glycyl-tRNA synthetase [Candidatus Nomurabacteria bacterium GW2011_GWB1_36_6]KKQ13178.1 MAG: glycyl-tRNA syntheta